MGISLHGGSAGQPGVGSSTGDFERWLKERVSLSLSGRCVKETWREGSLAGGPVGEVEKSLEMGISFHRGPAGEPGRGLIYQRL
jgi:hypothetical protein